MQLTQKGAQTLADFVGTPFTQTPVSAAGADTPFKKGAMAEFLPRVKELKPRSCELRTNSTKQENRLWYDFLRDCKPRFTRQRIIGKYIIDFYCHKVALVVELDGSQHFEKDAIEYDKARTAWLNALGIRVIRFTNKEVDNNFNGVCTAILNEIKAPFSKGVSAQPTGVCPPKNEFQNRGNER